MVTRPSWPEYAMGLAEAAASRSEDPYVKVGACILRHDYSVASTGYNGAPSGVDIDWTDRVGRRPFVSHAEANALRYIRPMEGLLIATTLLPCSRCLIDIKAYGFRVVYWRSEGRDRMAFEMAEKLGVKLIQI